MFIKKWTIHPIFSVFYNFSILSYIYLAHHRLEWSLNKMSLFKNWKLIVATMTVAMFTACAGGGNSDNDDIRSDAEEGYSEVDNGGSGAAAKKKKEPPKEVIDENKLKKTEQEATAINEDNHKLRKEIFDAKNKLGMSTAEDAE